MRRAAALLALALQLSAASLKVQVSGHVVEMPLEKYVAAVLAGEAGVFRSDEALKAMAVVARTYGMRMRGRHAADGFDLCGTTHCQRIDPNAVTARLQRMADATAGEMLWYRQVGLHAIFAGLRRAHRGCGRGLAGRAGGIFEKPLRGPEHVQCARGRANGALVWSPMRRRYRHGAAEAGIADAGADHWDSRGREN